IKNWIYEKIFKLKPFQGDFLADIFRDYKILMINNYINKMQCREFLSEEKFEKKYGEKPWNVINGILNNKILLNFVFEEPEIMDFTSQYQVVCKNTIGDKFFVSDISSGEKVLLSIIINIFSAIKKRIEPVKLILLDELDASLHPSMIQNLLNLLEKIFVKEYNIKVVLTTHSPTTVALADNKYLYYITSDSDNVKRIIKKDKDFILKKLAYGITTLSVSYINRKNIITESEYDAENLSKIYEILLASKDIESHISLNFIPSGVNGTDVSGDCNRVCKIVGKFDNYANVYGVIDWDLKNNTKDKIFVLAENERYSIENCILDPLMIVCMLLLDNKAPIDPSEFGLSKYFALPKDKNFEENIQKVIDSFINKISKQIKFKDINIKTTVGYIGGLKVEIPTEYLHFKGHRLEELLKQEFNQLKQYRNPNDLKKVIINMLKQYPEFIPNCFKELFLKIIK
ncbi:MAG: AAA family ATPase, partial [Endomicrobiaceae bacterium]